jgi:hypothetical protein
MFRNGWRLPLKYVHEVASSGNIALGITNIFFLLAPAFATSAFFQMDAKLSRRLGLLADLRHPKDSFTPGYFAFFVPAIAIGGCFWFLLRLFDRTVITREFDLRVAGIAALTAAPISWLFRTWTFEKRYGWSALSALQSYETGFALVLLTVFMRKPRPSTEWPLFVILALHFSYWFWQFGPHFFFGAYAGPLAPAAGLCAGLLWIMYRRQSKGGLPSSAP